MPIAKAVYPGTFDPPTLGHIDIVNRCMHFFDEFYIGVGTNSSKQEPVFSCKERVDLLCRLFKTKPKVKVAAFSGLLVDFVEQHSIDVVIRSFRTTADINSEVAQASLNRQMTGVETFWINPQPQYRDISSTLVKEIGMGKRSLEHFVPQEIIKDVENRFISK